MPTHEERRTRTRLRLVEAAVGVLVDRGLDGFTTSAVARRAEVAHGSVFRHFPTKQDLLVAAVEGALDACRADHVVAFTARVDAERPSDVDALVRVALESLWCASTDPRALAVMEVRARCRFDEGLRLALESVLRADHAIGGETVALLLPDAFHLSTSDFLDLSRVVLNAMQGRALAAIARPDPERDEAILESLISLVQARYPATTPEPLGNE